METTNSTQISGLAILWRTSGAAWTTPRPYPGHIQAISRPYPGHIQAISMKLVCGLDPAAKRLTEFAYHRYGLAFICTYVCMHACMLHIPISMACVQGTANQEHPRSQKDLVSVYLCYCEVWVWCACMNITLQHVKWSATFPFTARAATLTTADFSCVWTSCTMHKGSSWFACAIGVHWNGHKKQTINFPWHSTGCSNATAIGGGTRGWGTRGFRD